MTDLDENRVPKEGGADLDEKALSVVRSVAEATDKEGTSPYAFGLAAIHAYLAALAPKDGGAGVALVERCMGELTCDQQFQAATRLASDVGYLLVPESSYDLAPKEGDCDWPRCRTRPSDRSDRSP